MNPLAIQKAKIRLNTAKKAVADLADCKDYDTFVGIWYTFLVAAKGIYTALEQGAKASPQSKQWFGGKSRERREDPLLQYLYQARDDDEHGLNNVTALNPGYTLIGVAKPGYSNHISLSGVMGPGAAGLGGLNVTSHDGKPVLVEQVGPHAELIAVHGRGHRTYNPPTVHLGAPMMTPLPAGVATVAINYFDALICEAEALS